MSNKEIANLSVILPTYGRDEILHNVLKQLLDQEVEALEIIVIDQTKKRKPEIKAFLDTLIRENKIRYIYQDVPHANVARNRGIRKAKGDIILILNDDIIIGHNFIGAHFSNYKDSTIAAVSGQVLEDGTAPTDKFPKCYYRRYTGWMYFPLNFSKRMQVINLNACNLSIRKEIIFEAGGFDENFIKTYFDDTDLSLRVHKICCTRGLKAVHDPVSTLIHLKEKGGNRPGGINEYVIADRYAWMTWLYFFLMDFGIFGLWEIALRLRSCVLRKKNILRPYYLWLAFLEFIVGMNKALRLIRKGRRLLER